MLNLSFKGFITRDDGDESPTYEQALHEPARPIRDESVNEFMDSLALLIPDEGDYCVVVAYDDGTPMESCVYGRATNPERFYGIDCDDAPR